MKVGQGKSIQIERTHNLKDRQIYRLQENVDYFQVNNYKLLIFQDQNQTKTSILKVFKNPTKQEKVHKLQSHKWKNNLLVVCLLFGLVSAGIGLVFL